VSASIVASLIKENPGFESPTGRKASRQRLQEPSMML